MEKIKITNFGPVNSLEIKITNFITLFGPQASGKSTISKSIYFFKSLRDDFIKMLIESIQNSSNGFNFTTYVKNIRYKFLNLFGATYHLDDILLEYTYSSESILTISLEKTKKFVDPRFSPSFSKELKNIIADVKFFIEENHSNKGEEFFLSSSELISIETERNLFYKRLQDRVNKIFGDDRELLFIPAGRSFIATFSNKLQTIFRLQSVYDKEVDYITKSFLDRIINMKNFFSKGLDELVLERRALTQDRIFFSRINLAKKLMKDILKAEYKSLDGQDRLYLDNSRYVHLNYSSSGQQESIWILYLIFMLILSNKKCFVVFEEPEAHLFPKSQKSITNLMALLLNSNDNQVIITTHSPYILSSLNNLIYAYNVGQSRFNAVADIVNKNLWINYLNMSAYFVSQGVYKDLLDEETKMIDSDKIDEVSSQINDEFEKLYELEGRMND